MSTFSDAFICCVIAMSIFLPLLTSHDIGVTSTKDKDDAHEVLMTSGNETSDTSFALEQLGYEAKDQLGHDVTDGRTSPEAKRQEIESASMSDISIKEVVEEEEEDDGEVKDIWLIGLFPMQGSWPGGLGQKPAIEIALDHVNKDKNILRGYRLRMTSDDTKCDVGVGTNAMFQQLYKPPAKVLILGAGCSKVTQSTAEVSHLWNLVQLSYSSASPTLSMKSIYKRFFRVFPTETSFNPAKFDLLEKFNWKKVGMLYEAKENMFLMTADDFVEKAAARGVKIVTSEGFVNDPRPQVQNLKKQNVRIIIGNFYESKAGAIFCEAYRQKMYGPRYAWIVTGFYTHQWWRRKDADTYPHDCTDEEMNEVVQGYFTADALPLTNEPGISGKTYQEFHEEYVYRTNGSNLTGFTEAPYGYDSVWAVAAMLNESAQYMKDQKWGRNIEDFNYQDVDMAQLFLRVMNATNFKGISGPVMFDENGDRKGLTQIEQLQNGVEVQIGHYDPSSTETNKLTWIQEIKWQDGAPPPDSIIEKITPRVISVGLFILMTVLGTLGILLSCFFLVFNIRYRHLNGVICNRPIEVSIVSNDNQLYSFLITLRYIKMSSPNMNNFILTGAILAFSSVIFGGTDSNLASPEVHRIMCKCYIWTLALGFSLAFGAMFSKTWRVHRIFTNKKIQRMVIKDSQLIGIVCVLVSFDILVLILWEVLDPLKIEVYNKTAEHVPDPQNDNQELIPQSRFCESSHMWYFAGGLYGIKGLLLLFGAFLAFETRKVTVPVLNDSKFIGISVYNVVVLCLIGVPTAFMIKEQVDAAYTLISLFTFFATTLTICLIFIPKLLKRNREPHTGSMWTKASESALNQRRALDAITGLVTQHPDEKTELEQLREENVALRESLEECQRQLRDKDRPRLTLLDLPSPCTQTEEIHNEELTCIQLTTTTSLPNISQLESCFVTRSEH